MCLGYQAAEARGHVAVAGANAADPYQTGMLRDLAVAQQFKACQWLGIAIVFFLNPVSI